MVHDVIHLELIRECHGYQGLISRACLNDDLKEHGYAEEAEEDYLSKVKYHSNWLQACVLHLLLFDAEYCLSMFS